MWAKASSKTSFHSNIRLATVLQLVTLVLHTIISSQFGPTPSSSSNRFVIENSERQGYKADVVCKPQTINLDGFNNVLA
ncbi:hypothetical protein TNCV_4136811 [Trichonephila clavipes]|nr:hypothetical protein TNCV_4136811 [Trichonephila clavipes]